MTRIQTAARTLMRRADTHVTSAVTAAALLFAISYIHLADQGFLAFDKDPSYLLAAYLLVEIAAPVVGIALLRRPSMASWLFAAGCAAGPVVGFVLTRTTGLPGATDDIGNWSEPLGVASLIVEGALLLIAAVELLRLHVAGRSAIRPVMPAAIREFAYSAADR
jgi:hypothetical protein